MARKGITRAQVATLVLGEHPRRQRNPRSADWQVSGAGLVVASNWPAEDDGTAAFVVTVITG